jgi:hypothetical protein
MTPRRAPMGDSAVALDRFLSKPRPREVALLEAESLQLQNRASVFVLGAGAPPGKPDEDRVESWSEAERFTVARARLRQSPANASNVRSVVCVIVGADSAGGN